MRGELLTYVASAALTGAIAGYAWRRRPAPGAVPLAISAWAQTAWTLLHLFEIVTPGLEAKLVLDGLQHGPAVVHAAACVALAADLTGRPRPPILVPLGAVGWVGAVALALAPWHGVARAGASVVEGVRFATLIYPFGLADLVMAVLVLTPVLAAVVLIADGAYRQPDRPGLGLVGVGIGLPAVTQTVGVALGVRVFDQRDSAFAAFGLCAVLLAAGFARSRAPGLGPLARAAAFDLLPDPVLVFDPRGQLVDGNPAARRLFSLPREGLPSSARRAEARLAALVQLDPSACSEVRLPSRFGTKRGG